MSTPLDSILSRDGQAAPEQERTEEQVTQQVATEGESQTEQPTEGQAAEGDGEGGREAPIAALQAERQKARSYKEELAESRRANDETRRALEETRRHNAELQRFFQAQQQQKPQSDPMERVLTDPIGLIDEQLTAREAAAAQREYMKDRFVAEQFFGKEEVAAAIAAFDHAYANRTINAGELQEIASSPNRPAAAVQWHKQQKTNQLVRDPRVSKLLEQASRNPELLDRLETVFSPQHQGNDQQPAQQRQQVMPTNYASVRNVGSRSQGPTWAGQQPLQSIFADNRQTRR